MELPKRKNIRLNGYDYSQNGAYFLTVCTDNREHLLSEVVVGQGLCSCRLTDIDTLIECEIKKIPERFSNVCIEKYVIMPNHIHMIVVLKQRQEQSPCPTNPTIDGIICAYKSITTKLCNVTDNMPGRKIWQFRYHDHIVRSDDDYQKIWQYIDENPAKWTADKYYTVD